MNRRYFLQRLIGTAAAALVLPTIKTQVAYHPVYALELARAMYHQGLIERMPQHNILSAMRAYAVGKQTEYTWPTFTKILFDDGPGSLD